jgi:hypothetical protein
MVDKIRDCKDLEIAAEQSLDAIAFPYSEFVISPPGCSTGNHPSGIKTLRRGEERFANYLILRRGQVTGLSINEILQITTKHSDRPRDNQ